jgi:hypothetical protein
MELGFPYSFVRFRLPAPVFEFLQRNDTRIDNASPSRIPLVYHGYAFKRVLSDNGGYVTRSFRLARISLISVPFVMSDGGPCIEPGVALHQVEDRPLAGCAPFGGPELRHGANLRRPKWATRQGGTARLP